MEPNEPLGTIAYASSTATRMAYGGIIVWTTNSLRKRDVIKVKVIRGGLYDAEDYSLNYVGGCGVAIYVNDILKLTVGGGGCCDGARTYSSSGGGGGGYYGGGGGSNGTGIAGSGYSGHSNADGGTMRSCYGGSSYIDSNINSNELSVILGCSGYYVNNYKPFGNSSEPTSGNGGAGYAKIEVI